jgi:hypothetical protein
MNLQTTSDWIPIVLLTAALVVMRCMTVTKMPNVSNRRPPTMPNITKLVRVGNNADHLGQAQQQRDTLPTICRPSAEHQPTMRAAVGSATDRLVQFGTARPLRRVKPQDAAAAFLAWSRQHQTPGANGQEVAVDDLLWIATNDFAPANGVAMPPSRVFLGALKKIEGVVCTQDRRIYDKDGKVKGKTTFYRLADPIEFVAEAVTKLAA